jgi:hypothetical protein
MRQVLIGTLIAAALLLTASDVYADCYYQGQPYPVGTRLGPLTCMPDGTWR